MSKTLFRLWANATFIAPALRFLATVREISRHLWVTVCF